MASLTLWCSRPASNSARCLSFCLPACHPICQFSTDREAARGAEMSGADAAGAARGKSAGHRRSQLKVTWPFDFVTCHQLPCLTPHRGVPAIHRRCLPSASVSTSLCLPESSSVSFCLLLPLHLLFSFSLSFQSLYYLFMGGGGVEGVTSWRRWGVIGIAFLSFASSFPDVYSPLPVFCVPLNEGRCQEAVRSGTQRMCLRSKVRKKT